MRAPAGPIVPAFVLAACAVWCASCAHADAFENGTLRKGDLRVVLGPVPPTWHRLAIQGADLAFRDDAREGSALVEVHCGARGQDAPLAILTENLIMGTTEREFESQRVVPFDGREAMQTMLRAKLDGVPMQYEIYVMKKDGCVYDLVYFAPPERFLAGAADFERFVLGMHAGSSGKGDVRASAENGDGTARDP